MVYLEKDFLKTNLIAIRSYIVQLFFSLSCLVVCPAFAQDYSYAHYDVKEGLASSVVYGAVQDKDGFIWFATEAGLSRFDGVNFKNFTIQEGLPDNDIINVYVDSKNRVWVSPFKNTICYYYKGKIHTQENDSVLSSLKITSMVPSVVEDSAGNIFLMSNDAFFIISPDGKIKSFAKVEDRGFYGLTVGLDDNGEGLVAIQIKTLGFAIVGDLPTKPFLRFLSSVNSPNSTNSVLLKPGLQIFQIADALLYRKNGRTFKISVPENFISLDLLQDSIVSLNTAKGSYVYNQNGTRLVDVFLKNKIVNSVFSDDEGDWWFCTQGEGIFRLISSSVKKFSFQENGQIFPVYSIEKFDSSIYLGTDRYRVAIINNDRYELKKLYPGGFSGRVKAMARIPNGELLFGTDQVLVKGVPGKKIGDYPLSVKAMHVVGNELLVASNANVLQIRLSDYSISDTLWYQRSTAVYSINNLAYVGTLNGLFVVPMNDPANSPKEIQSLSGTKISTLGLGSGNILWVATYGKGLIGLKDGNPLHVITTEGGLSSNTCRTLFVKDNIIWVGTDRGINKVSVEGNKIDILKITSADGLASDIINAIYVDGSVVYAGTAEGVTRFDETKIRQNSTCRLRVTGIHAGQFNYYYDTSNFILPHFYNQFTVDFSGISFKSAGDIVYYYRLVGLNNSWQTTRANFISYPSLPSGDYTFELYAVNKYGIKSNIKTVSFNVKELFWETLWFKVLMLLCVLAAIWAFIVLRIRWLKKKETTQMKTRKRIMELEQMALKAQMNPHFIFNCLNSIQQYILEKDFAAVNKFITDFSSLIRKTLEVSSKTEIMLEEELQYINTYLRIEQARLEDKFSFEIHLQEGVSPAEYYLPPLILQPCLENSIRHGIRYRNDFNGKINIFIEKSESYLSCIIEDNGVGRKKAREYKGLSHIEYQSKGMELTVSRIEMLSITSEKKASVEWEDILNQQREIAGTRVVIRIPLYKTTKL